MENDLSYFADFIRKHSNGTAIGIEEAVLDTINPITADNVRAMAVGIADSFAVKQEGSETFNIKEGDLVVFTFEGDFLPLSILDEEDVEILYDIITDSIKD